MSECKHPTCGDQCRRPKRKSIRRFSKKRQREQVKYRKIIAEMAKESAMCEVNSPACIGIMSGAQHKQKRSPSNLLKRQNLKRSCDPCNGYIETHPEWAIKNGHSISKFSVVVAAHDSEVKATIIQ